MTETILAKDVTLYDLETKFSYQKKGIFFRNGGHPCRRSAIRKGICWTN